MRICTVDGCETPHVAKGLCGKHRARLRRHGDVNAARWMPMPHTETCTIANCGRPDVVARGLCTMHYGRAARYGDPLLALNLCTLDGCGRQHFAGGLCRHHDHVLTTYGDANHIAICKADDCDTELDYRSARGLCRTHYKRLVKYGDTRGVRVECSLCDAEFYPVNSLRKVCDSCMASEVRRHDVDVQVIVDRDGTDCSLCHQPVDFTQVWPHPKSPSIDHVIPWSLGGTHALDNMALACLRCNISKGNRVSVRTQ